MWMPTSEPTDEQATLYAEFETLCADNPVAVMVLDRHRLDESGQCAECRDVADAHIGGDDLVPIPVAWPCDTAFAVRHAVLGWTVEQVRAVEFQCHRQVAAKRRGTPLALKDVEETLALREQWVTSGIPAHRAVLYATADIALDEARTHETSGRASDDLDRTVAVLVALQ